MATFVEYLKGVGSRLFFTKMPLEMSQKELKIRSVGQTRIVEIAVDSTNPKTAAEFANRLAADYIEENVQSGGK